MWPKKEIIVGCGFAGENAFTLDLGTHTETVGKSNSYSSTDNNNTTGREGGGGGGESANGEEKKSNISNPRHPNRQSRTYKIEVFSYGFPFSPTSPNIYFTRYFCRIFMDALYLLFSAFLPIFFFVIKKEKKKSSNTRKAMHKIAKAIEAIENEKCEWRGEREKEKT